jgi:hypothetical protein
MDIPDYIHGEGIYFCHTRPLNHEITLIHKKKIARMQETKSPSKTLASFAAMLRPLGTSSEKPSYSPEKRKLEEEYFFASESSVTANLASATCFQGRTKRFRSEDYSSSSYKNEMCDKRECLGRNHQQFKENVPHLQISTSEPSLVIAQQHSRVIISQRSGDVTFVSASSKHLGYSTPMLIAPPPPLRNLAEQETCNQNSHSAPHDLLVKHNGSPKKGLQFVSLVPKSKKMERPKSTGNSGEKHEYVFVEGIDEYDIKKFESHASKHNRGIENPDRNKEKSPPRLVARKGAYSRHNGKRNMNDGLFQTFQLK